ncbi:hypothetical protein HDV05_006215 [Chytridiales sp. JEL 0842]|nr:hypothetical protein HDV05_006215 [Chytridiales sp. JEL 0842]
MTTLWQSLGKVVSEVESRIDRVLDIQAPAAQDTSNAAAAVSESSDSDRANGANDLDSLFSTQNLTAGLSSFTSSISSSIQAAASATVTVAQQAATPAAGEKDFFSSMLSGFGAPSSPSSDTAQKTDALPEKKTEARPPRNPLKSPSRNAVTSSSSSDTPATPPATHTTTTTNNISAVSQSPSKPSPTKPIEKEKKQRNAGAMLDELIGISSKSSKKSPSKPDPPVSPRHHATQFSVKPSNAPAEPIESKEKTVATMSLSPVSKKSEHIPAESKSPRIESQSVKSRVDGDINSNVDSSAVVTDGVAIPSVKVHVEENHNSTLMEHIAIPPPVNIPDKSPTVTADTETIPIEQESEEVEIDEKVPLVTTKDKKPEELKPSVEESLEQPNDSKTINTEVPHVVSADNEDCGDDAELTSSTLAEPRVDITKDAEAVEEVTDDDENSIIRDPPQADSVEPEKREAGARVEVTQIAHKRASEEAELDGKASEVSPLKAFNEDDEPLPPKETFPDAGTKDPGLAAEVSQLRKVIEQREKQLMAALTENAELLDTATALRIQVQELEQYKQSEGSNADGALKDLTERLSVAEKQLAVAIKERDQLKQQIVTLQQGLDESVKHVQSREERIKDLLAEGEKLSKNELKISTIVKKLRAKEAETDKEIKDLMKKLESSAGEVSDLKERIQKLVEAEKRLNDSLKSANETNEQQAKQIVKLENELSLAKDECAQVKSLLERTRSDLNDTRKSQAEAQSAAHAEALERELRANEALHKELEELQRSSINSESTLRKEIFDLRSTLARIEDEMNWKEDGYRREIASLHSRIQEAEARHEDLSSQARLADRPLVRQIEALQDQYASARRDWEQIETTLTLRLQDAERERSNAVEKERALAERYNELNNRFVSLELQSSRERQERSRFLAELETERAKVEGAEKMVNDLTVKLDHVKAAHGRAMEEAKANFQETLQRRLKEESVSWEAKLREERSKSSRDSESDDRRPTLESAGRNSISSPSPLTIQTSWTERSPDATSASALSASGPSAVVIDRLHAGLKQYQGQVSTLQRQLALATETRDELAEELVKATNEITDLKSLAAKSQALEKEKEDLNNRYMAALELLGEKTEQLEDTQQDLAELRKAFKAQVEDLMKQVEKSNGK